MSWLCEVFGHRVGGVNVGCGKATYYGDLWWVSYCKRCGERTSLWPNEQDPLVQKLKPGLEWKIRYRLWRLLSVDYSCCETWHGGKLSGRRWLWERPRRCSTRP